MQHLINNKRKLIESVNFLCTQDRLSHDTETKGNGDISGLHPFHGARAFSHIFATSDDEFYFDFNKGGINRKYIKELFPIFRQIDRLIFYVNAVFDNTIMYMDGIINHARIADCPALARVEFNRHGKREWEDESFLSLDYLAKYYLKTSKNDKVKEYIKEHNLFSKVPCRIDGKPYPLYDKVPLELMFPYGCSDARTTYDIGDKIIKCINYKDDIYGRNTKMINVAQNEIALTTEVIKMKIGGLKVWVDYVDRAVIHEKKIEKDASEIVEKVAPGLNINSGAQVGDYLTSKGVKVARNPVTKKALLKAAEYDKRIIELTSEKKISDLKIKAAKKRIGNYKTDADSLANLSEKYDLPFLKQITIAKRANKKISTYYNNFLNLRDKNDIIHCGLHQETTKTGRFSSRTPNLQNIHKEKWVGNPDDLFVRRSFIANEPDELLLFADYKQQEMMVMLDQAEEMGVIKLLLSGEFDDFYLATAAIIKNKTRKEISRAIAKAIALGLAYGQGKDLLAKNLKCSVNEAMDIKSAFFSALPKLKELDNYLKREARIRGKIHNPYGRVTYLAKDKDYTALNAFVQGTSADITKTAMVLIGKKLRDFKSVMALTVHDELVFRVKEDELTAIVRVIRKEMVRAYKGKHLELGVDFELSYRNKEGYSSWGEKIKYIGE